MNTLAETEDFRQYLVRRVAASDAFVCGDVGPLMAVSGHADPVSLFGPSGGTVVGARAVDEANSAGASHFRPGSSNAFEEVQSGASGDIGYWVGVQRSEVVVAGRDEPVRMALRLTEVYRRDDQEWKLVHRHADELSQDSPG